MNKVLATTGASLLALGILATQIDSRDPAVKQEVEDAAKRHEDLTELALIVYPDVDLTPRCCRLQNGNLCRFGREYGPGKGGVTAKGEPLSCSCDKSRAYLCDGESPEDGELVDALKAAGRGEELLERIARKVAEGEAKPREDPKGEPSENPGGLGGDTKGGGR